MCSRAFTNSVVVVPTHASAERQLLRHRTERSGPLNRRGRLEELRAFTNSWASATAAVADA
jgi:hypothetical protein